MKIGAKLGSLLLKNNSEFLDKILKNVHSALLVGHTSAIRGRMIELASYIGTINWRWKMDVRLAISCKLGIRPITLLG